MGTRSPLTIFTGQRAQIRGVTQSHGVIRPNMVDAVDFNPTLTSHRVPEFDNLVDALTYQTFDGGQGKFSFTKSNQGQIEALMMDADPLVEEIYTNPSLFRPMTLFANMKGLDGKIKGSYLLQDCKVMGDPFTSTVKEGAKGSVDFEYINGFLFHGVGLLYTRARGSQAPVGTPAQPTLAATAVPAGSLSDDTYYVRIAAVTATGESAGSNETAIHLTGGTAIQEIDVTIPALAAPITSYNIYVSNRSNGERFAANDAVGGGVFVISSLPSATADKVSNIDTTGVYQAAGDKVFTTGGPPESVAFDQTAFQMAQTGLDYALVKKNGQTLATVDNPATEDTFLIDAAGNNFSIIGTPADNEWWDIFTPFKPL